jgi:AcrR family transcriptional regulator
VDGERGEPRAGGWERKRIRTSLNIELAALRLIRERGVESVTVEQVAAAAGISVRTFYRYFLNVPDVLTGVAKRQTDWSCRMVLARPPGEDILDAFRSTFAVPDEAQLPPEVGEVLAEAAEALQLWGEIVRRDPDDVALRSHAVSYMTTRYQDVIRRRLGLDEDDDAPGVLAAALAGVIWFVYVRWVERDGVGAASLFAALDDAFERLRETLDQRPARDRRAG